MQLVDKFHEKNILVLVNPLASQREGLRVWSSLKTQFEQLFAGFNIVVLETSSKEHNIEIGATTSAELIISVSGDGMVHDIAQGIMRRPLGERPALAVLPVGSGNDFARSLGMPVKPAQALDAIYSGHMARVDVGRVRASNNTYATANTNSAQAHDLNTTTAATTASDAPEHTHSSASNTTSTTSDKPTPGKSSPSFIETFFLETLSFGLDAAIAINTVEKRLTSKKRGLSLYASVAVTSIIRDLKKHSFRIIVDGKYSVDDDLMICAIQNGPTYGGGFKVAPQAKLDDGLLNICMATDVSKVYALYALALMAKGKHERLPKLKTMRASGLVIDIDTDIATQCDGERIVGRHFEIDVMPQSLDVIVAKEAAIACMP